MKINLGSNLIKDIFLQHFCYWEEPKIACSKKNCKKYIRFKSRIKCKYIKSLPVNFQKRHIALFTDLESRTIRIITYSPSYVGRRALTQWSAFEILNLDKSRL